MPDQFTTIDEYIAAAPPPVQPLLAEVRAAVRRAVPDATEAISYGMPTVRVDGGYLVYFGAWKHHIGIYPVGQLDEPIESELAPYRAAKATLRFALGAPLPLDLIERLVRVLAARSAATPGRRRTARA